jgi:hypothetical protein
MWVQHPASSVLSELRWTSDHVFQDAMQVMLFYYLYRQATPSISSISPSSFIDQISFLILNSFSSSSTGKTATLSVIAKVNKGENLLNRLETHFKTSSMAMTGALINSTACHSCQFNGVIWNKVKSHTQSDRSDEVWVGPYGKYEE